MEGVQEYELGLVDKFFIHFCISRDASGISLMCYFFIYGSVYSCSE